MSTILVTLMGWESPLGLAWQHTGEFWAHTGAAIARHPLAVLACAAVPAAERGYVHLHPNQVSRARLALLEALVTLWRVLLCGVAVWAASSGVEWRSLRQQLGAMAAWQVALEELGLHLAHHLRMVLWQFLFLIAALWLAHSVLRWALRAPAARVVWLRDGQHRRAMMSILRNLVFAPVTVIYLVEMARPAFQ